MRISIFALATLMLIGVSEAQDNAMTGRGLLIVCLAEKIGHERDPNQLEEAFCHGFIQGVHDTTQAERKTVCPPAETQRGDIATAVIDSLQSDERRKNLPAWITVFETMLTMHPCY